MCNYVLFWISYLLSALQWILILKRFFVTHGLGPGKPGPRAAKPITPAYLENNYRIEVKSTFMLIAYLVLLCEFFWEFSIFQFCRPLVDIYCILGDPGAVSRAERKGATKVFKHRRKSPSVPTLTGPFSNGQVIACSWLGTKNALYYCAQSANSFHKFIIL